MTVVVVLTFLTLSHVVLYHQTSAPVDCVKSEKHALEKSPVVKSLWTCPKQTTKHYFIEHYGLKPPLAPDHRPYITLPSIRTGSTELYLF